MAVVDFSGTNTEKGDKLIAAVIELRTELRTTLRLFFGFVLVCFPLVVGLQVFLVTQSFRNEAKVDRLNGQVDALRIDNEKLDNRMKQVEQAVEKLDDRMKRVEQAVIKPAP